MLTENLENGSVVTLHAKIFTGPSNFKQWDREVMAIMHKLRDDGHALNFDGWNAIQEVWCVTVEISEEVKAILAETNIVFSTSPQFGSLSRNPKNKQPENQI